jgi:hypothetical protein
VVLVSVVDNSVLDGENDNVRRDMDGIEDHYFLLR